MSKEDSDDEYYTAMLNVEKSRQIRMKKQLEHNNKRLHQIRRDMAAISDRDFVVAWQQSNTLDQLLTVLNVPAKDAIDRAATLRKNGVALKSL